MASLTIEGLHPVLLGISGDFDVFQVNPPDPFFINPNPNSVIQTTQPWGVTVRFQQAGWMIPIINPACTWRAQVLLEEIGPGEFSGFAGGLGSFSINFVPIDGHTYSPIINLPPGTVPAGVYKLHFFMQMYGPGNNPLPVVAQGEYGTVTIYAP